MTLPRTLALFALATGALSAQAPVFADGSALGGSRVFSEGLNPLGNPARFVKPAAGTYLGWAEGDQGAKETKTALRGLWDPAATASGLATLAEKSWAQRTRAFGVAYVDKGKYGSYTREESTGLMAAPDLNPAHLGPGLNLNSTSVDVRRMVVDRMSVGAGAFDQGTGYGISLRMERWKTGQTLATLLPSLGPTPLDGRDLLAFQDTVGSAHTVMTVDLGITQELLQGLRFGASVDRLLPRRFGDVYEGALFRAGFELDLGATVQLSVDSDINRTMRMPFPVRQRTTTASLRITPGPSTTLILGAERRSMAGESLIRGGATLFVNGRTWHIGAGFQASQDRPMKGAALSVF